MTTICFCVLGTPQQWVHFTKSHLMSKHFCFEPSNPSFCLNAMEIFSPLYDQSTHMLGYLLFLINSKLWLIAVLLTIQHFMFFGWPTYLNSNFFLIHNKNDVSLAPNTEKGWSNCWWCYHQPWAIMWCTSLR